MWQDNWVSFLDTMLQFSLIGVKYRALMLPTRIRKISVDPSTLLRDIKHEDSKRTVPVSWPSVILQLMFRLSCFLDWLGNHYL